MKGQIEIKSSFPVKEQRKAVISFGDAKVELLIDVDGSPQSLKKIDDLAVVFANARKYVLDIKDEINHDPKYQRVTQILIDGK